jgi:Ca2+-binding RTX toxin-like protein
MPDSGRRLWPAAATTALITGLLASTAYGAVIDGTPGNDRIHGKAEADQISALTGDDVVHARRGSDTVDLGPGNDRGFGGRGDDKVYGGDGRDFISSGFGDDSTTGDAGDDTIFANKGRDTIDGGDGNDRLFALSRKDVNRPDDTEGDTVRGGTGDDRIAVRDGERDVVNCGPGVDRALLDFKDVLEDNSCEVVARRAPNRRDSRVEDRNEGDQP